jgi:hypothetical protein
MVPITSTRTPSTSDAELLGNVVHARVHAQEAAPSFAAADALFDQLLQLAPAE